MLKTLLIACLAAVIPFGLYSIMPESILRLFLVVVFSWFSVVLLVYSIGVNPTERIYLLGIVRKYLFSHHG